MIGLVMPKSDCEYKNSCIGLTPDPFSRASDIQEKGVALPD